MPNILPKIDRRSQQDLVDEIRRLILYYCPELGSIDDISSDEELNALVNIFSNMTGYITDALNKAPDKNFTAFLNLIGVSPTSPIPANAPLVFKLKEDWDKEGFIPAGAKISAQPENQPEVVFETKSDLTVIRPGLVRAVSIEPEQDKWSDLDFLFAPEPTGAEAELFRGENRIIHRMYIGNSQLLSLNGAEVNLRFKLPEQKCLIVPQEICTVKINGKCTLQTKEKCPSESCTVDKCSFEKCSQTGCPVKKYPIDKCPVEYCTVENCPAENCVTEDCYIKNCTIEWFYFDEKGNSQPLKLASGRNQSNLRNNEISFPGTKLISPKTISGYNKNKTLQSWSNNWIYAELRSPINAELIPDIEDIELSVTISEEKLSPEIALFNYAPIDLSKDFYPFGEKPVFNDTFYLSCNNAFSKKNADITLDVKLSNAKKTPDTEEITIAWEYWDGKKWDLIKKTGKPVPIASSDDKEESTDSTSFDDGTCALTANGQIKFKCPERIQPCIINGESNFWIRLRIIGGNYGEDGRFKYNGANTTYIEPTFAPPSIKEIQISYTYESEKTFPETLVVENNFETCEKTEECLSKNKSFKLFSPCTDTDPAVYLGFDRDITNLPISLFFPLNGDQIAESPVVAWEYWNGRKWLTISINDALRDFTRREIQLLNVPLDIEKTPLFGTEQYWIRARLEEGGFSIFPKVNAIYTNAVWTANSNTLTNEILGSINGEPNQTFQFSRTPVLPGQTVNVQEIIGNGAPTEWEEVQTFSLSASDSRHYMLDSNKGVLSFGDGRNGMIPPAGKDNITVSYKIGGGAAGNVNAGTIKKMWDEYPGIDSAANPVPADGGFDREEVEEAKIRGPHTLKSMDRGITCEDIEWLVREAAPQIALVKCFPTMDRKLDFVPGKGTVIVVPDNNDPKPVPSQELIGGIDRYLAERIPAIMNIKGQSQLDVIGPDYIRIGIEANVVYSTPESTKIIEGHIIDNLKEFLNPLRGGQEKTGWTLGKNLYISEVCSVIKNTPGVDYITDIAVKSSVQCYTLNIRALNDGPFRPGISYPAYSAVKTGDNRIVFALAQKLTQAKDVKTLLVKGFREGDRITLSYRNCPKEDLIVEAVEGDILQCRTFSGEPVKTVYPVGSDIQAEVTRDLTIRSFILNQISDQLENFYIKIAVPEARDTVYLCRNDEYTNTTPLKIREVRAGDVFLEEDQLVYSGEHIINKKLELKFPYLLNRDTNIIHDLSSTKAECRIGEILKEDRRYLEKISDAAEAVICDYCFKKDE
ncbi:MAG TPA: putative baseplate assembly protein [Ruminiclostridium sp.]|nr:putative baseplate assembly protein [Ruminiclostridium sp.]